MATRFNAVKVFSATGFEQRTALGDTVATWLENHPEQTIADVSVTQSSDGPYHCTSITIFYWSARESRPLIPIIVDPQDHSASSAR